MVGPAPKRMKVDEYLAWAMQKPERPRFELHCGEVEVSVEPFFASL